MEKPVFRFKEPKAKRRTAGLEFCPLPVFNEWNRSVFVGRLEGDSVHVDDTSDIRLLYSMGFFGKGNLSWSNPQYPSGLQEQSRMIMSRRRYLTHCKWASILPEHGDVDVLPYKKKLKTDTSLTPDGIHGKAPASTIVPEVDAMSPSLLQLQLTANAVAHDCPTPDPWLNNGQEESEAFWGTRDQGETMTGASNAENSLKHLGEDVQNVLSQDNERVSVTSEFDSAKCVEEHDSNLLCAEDSSDLGHCEPVQSDDSARCVRHCELVQSDDPEKKRLFDVGKDLDVHEESVDLSLGEPDDDGLCVVDDTEDSEIDRGERPTWTTVFKRDPYPLSEHLILSLEEAFFLSYGIGCLVLNDSSNRPMNLTETWQTFCKTNVHFAFRYAAYQYYRSKSWVPKSGIKYGVDFLLYKWGPSFYHGTYSVKVKAVREGQLKSNSVEHLSSSWTSLSCLNRVTEQVSKELLLCYVIVPDALLDADLLSPLCIADFKITEVITRRWISKRERENSEFYVIP